MVCILVLLFIVIKLRSDIVLGIVRVLCRGRDVRFSSYVGGCLLFLVIFSYLC